MIWVPLNGAATLVFLLGSKVSVNYSMAPPRDAVDQTVARPPVADGDPYSTPVPRHFASNSMGFFSPSQWHMNSMFFFPSQWHMFFFAFPILGRHFVGPLLILFFWKVRRSFLPPYGTPTDQARGVPVFYCGREWLWKGNHQLDFLPRCGQQAILGKEWFNFWWEAWENSVTSGDGGWVKIYDIVYYMGHKWVKICDRMFGEWLSIKQLFQGTFRVGFRCGQGHQFSCIKEGL